MKHYILDTNICIALVRHRDLNVLKRLTACGQGEVGLSSITLSEITYGIEKSAQPERNRIAWASFCAPLIIHPYDEHASEEYGRIRANLERAGQPIGPLDTLIAAHAIALDAILVTNNEREFNRVPDLTVENWM